MSIELKLRSRYSMGHCKLLLPKAGILLSLLKLKFSFFSFVKYLKLNIKL